MSINPDLLYTEQHLWVKPVGDDQWFAGITDYAQDLLGDVVFVQAPAVGSQVTFGEACGLVESVKTGSDLFSPLTGSVIEVNEALLSTPELINDKPYDAWIFKIAATGSQTHLLSASDYQKFLDKN